MEKYLKNKVLEKVYFCCDFDKFKRLIKNWGAEEKLYAECFWLCSNYKYDKGPSDGNKLRRVAEKYGFDLDKIVKFSNSNIKHYRLDSRLDHLIKLNYEKRGKSEGFLEDNFDRDMLESASWHSFNNYDELMNSDVCGCYYCCKTFSFDDVLSWLWDYGGQTALCPYCEVDAVIGDASGYKITKALLKAMSKRWFGK